MLAVCVRSPTTPGVAAPAIGMRHTGLMAVVLGVLADTEAEAHEWVGRLTALGYEPVGRVMPAVAGEHKWLARVRPVVAETVKV